MQYFKDKVVWITGASSGLGREAAKQLISAGARLILSARRSAVLEKIKAEAPTDAEIFILPLDLARSENFAEAAARAEQHYGKIDVLINNAGISQRSYASETSLEVDRRIMEVNYFGTVALTKAVLPIMLKNGGGHFVTVTSLVGKFGFGVRSAYAASKHALHGFFESLHIELHARGIKVTLVCPGPVQTPISLHALDGSGKPSGQMDEMQAKGMAVERAVSVMLRAAAENRREVIIGNFKEKLGVVLKAWVPSLFFKLALKQNPRGQVKL